jgi:hypothetical protein
MDGRRGHAIEAGLLAAGDERSDVGQRPANWNPERDAEPAHRMRSFIRRPGLQAVDDRQPLIIGLERSRLILV